MKIKCPYCGHENIPGVDRCGKCLNAFTQKDVPQAGKDKLQKLVMTVRVGHFISKVPPIVVGPDTPIEEVILKMQAMPMKGCVLVCEGGRLTGIVSIRDILLKVAGVVKDPARTPVKTIMTPRPETLPHDAPLSYALHKMAIGRFRHVPVVDGEGRPVGVVSTRDLIEYLSGSDPALH